MISDWTEFLHDMSSTRPCISLLARWVKTSLICRKALNTSPREGRCLKTPASNFGVGVGDGGHRDCFFEEARSLCMHAAV